MIENLMSPIHLQNLATDNGVCFIIILIAKKSLKISVPSRSAETMASSSPLSSTSSAYINPIPAADAPTNMHRQNLDIYTQIGMQRLGQLYKSNMMSSSSSENKHRSSDSDIKPEQNVQQIVEAAIR